MRGLLPTPPNHYGTALTCFFGWVLNWHLVIGTISITDRRICKCIALIDKFRLSAPYVKARRCAVIAGHVMSMSPVSGYLTRLKTRFLYKVIESVVII